MSLCCPRAVCDDERLTYDVSELSGRVTFHAVSTESEKIEPQENNI